MCRTETLSTSRLPLVSEGSVATLVHGVVLQVDGQSAKLAAPSDALANNIIKHPLLSETRSRSAGRSLHHDMYTHATNAILLVLMVFGLVYVSRRYIRLLYVVGKLFYRGQTSRNKKKRSMVSLSSLVDDDVDVEEEAPPKLE